MNPDSEKGDYVLRGFEGRERKEEVKRYYMKIVMHAQHNMLVVNRKQCDYLHIIVVNPFSETEIVRKYSRMHFRSSLLL